MADRSINDGVVQAISDWLIEAALLSMPLEELIGGLCERLNDGEMGLLRVSVGTSILHPQFASQTVRWVRDEGTEREHFGPDSMRQPGWLNSPIRAAIERQGEPIRRRIAAGDRLDFEILHELKTRGATDYLALATIFQAYNRPNLPTGMVGTWATDRPGGYTDECIATILRLQPRLAVAVKSAVADQIATGIAATYLGRDAGRRVLEGAVERGDASSLHAAILFCDLRGFTTLADTMAARELLSLLDDYFDLIAEPIRSRDGQILKFMGDGLLATFELDEADLRLSVRDALGAAEAGLAAVEAFNRERRARGEAALDLDIALHVGEVMYGNVGARDRLDFTVIGPAVNEASRMEELCDRLDASPILSAEFVTVADLGDHVRDLGTHALRGVGVERRLFTTTAAPAADG